MSISGGHWKALEAARALHCESVQLFTASPQSWPVRPAPPAGVLRDDDVTLFQQHLARTRVQCLLAHDSYLINLASPDETLFRRSVEAFVLELERAERLGLNYLITHPGSHVESGEEAGLARVIQGLDEIHRRCQNFRVRVLLETTAGQGTSLGHRFEHLGWILNHSAEAERLGVCFDTCHVFAAGYELSPRKAYLATLREFDRLIGLERLGAFHLNDSVKPLGSRVDRHAGLGLGCLGLEPFRLLVNDRRFRKLPMVLETPKESKEGTPMDPINLKILRELAGSVPAP